jgi:hypothetical protein
MKVSVSLNAQSVGDRVPFSNQDRIRIDVDGRVSADLRLQEFWRRDIGARSEFENVQVGTVNMSAEHGYFLAKISHVFPVGIAQVPYILIQIAQASCPPSRQLFDVIVRHRLRLPDAAQVIEQAFVVLAERIHRSGTASGNDFLREQQSTFFLQPICRSSVHMLNRPFQSAWKFGNSFSNLQRRFHRQSFWGVQCHPGYMGGSSR